jgi:pterin-4a-carbinolamine dehydratase
MRRVSGLLESYFREASPKQPVLEMHLPAEVPIRPYTCSWEVHSDPERFARTYKFESRNRMIDFLNSVLSFEDEMGHHGAQRIDFDSVTIEVYTHTLNKITELDQEYIQSVDHIYGDVLDFAY